MHRFVFVVVATACLVGIGCGPTAATGGDAGSSSGADAGSISGFVTKAKAQAQVSNTCVLDLPPPACTDVFVDHGCDITPSCEGEVLGFEPDNPCAVCQPAIAGDTCEDARDGLRDLLTHTVSESCGNWCEDDSDCFAFTLRSACDNICVALFGGIDEEALMVTEEYARRRCGACGSGEVSIQTLGPTGHCVDHQCLFAEQGTD